MAQLLLVNPKRRKRKAAKKSARAPRRRRRKMTAKQAKYFAPKRKRRTSRARAAATTPARKVRRRRASRGLAGFARNTSGSVNPRAIVGPAVIGAAGALGLDVLYGYLPIPANLKAGTFAPLVKLGAVIGISMLASRFLPRQRALVKQAAGAAVTIAAYNFFKAQVQQRLPTVPLGEYVSGMGEYVGDSPSFPALGYVSPAQSFPDTNTNGNVGGYMPWGNPENQDEIF